MFRAIHDWWRRPCGGRAVLALALPLVISTMSFTVMTFIDRMFLTWYSIDSVAAAMPAAMLQFTLISFPLGMATYVNTFVAQYEGAGRPRQIGPAVWQGIWIALIATPLLLLTAPLAHYYFHHAGHDPGVVVAETTYYSVLIFGSGAIILAGTLSSFFTGRGATLVVMAVDTAAAALNAALAYAMIFGHWGFAEGGIAGAGAATVCAEWFRVISYSAIMMQRRYRKYHLAAGWRWNGELLARLWKFGAPGGMQWLIECGSFTLFITLVGGLGRVNQAGTMLAFNVNSVAWVPMMGMGVAVSTIVGQQLGASRPEMAARATWTAFVLAMLYMGTMSLFYLSVPDWFLKGHAAGMAADEFQPLQELVVVLLRFVAVYCLFDALNVVFMSAIRGAGDTRFVFWTSLVTSLVPLTLTWVGIHYLGQGLLWCWMLITLWVCSAGTIYFARFLNGKWRTMRVIEPESPIPAGLEPVVLGSPAEELQN
jgi:multidrug resistance protein, MATE family